MILRRLYDKLKLAWLVRRDVRSVELRRHYRERFDIDVGMHSYGCFDRNRIPGPLTVGRYCSFSGTARVVDANHPIDAISTSPYFYERKFGVIDRDIIHSDCLIIEDDVWVGHYAILMPGCKFVGRGAIIGAGAIVTADVPPYTIMAGVPARPIRTRFAPEIIERLEKSRWWEKEPAELRRLVQADQDLVYRPSVERLDALLERGWP